MSAGFAALRAVAGPRGS